MGLQPITMMLMLNNIKVLHLEVTDACNAACPQCAREFDLAFNKTNIHHLTVDQIQQLVSINTIKNLDKIFLCGVYGDPAAGKHTLDILHYFRSINPSIILGMNTNGGIRSTKWWETLGSLLNQPKDYVVFSIDGLADTNHIYRVNVNWSTVMQNAQAFIDSNGNAHWDMLVFKHNEHQIDTATNLARNMGFKYFRAKVSRRFELVPISFLNPPTLWAVPQVYQEKIECQALSERSVYISAQGKLYPCCWLGANTDFTLDKFEKIKLSWNSKYPNNICQQTCSGSTYNTFKDQWQREISF
jgi:hypothetical protein